MIVNTEKAVYLLTIKQVIIRIAIIIAAAEFLIMLLLQTIPSEVGNYYTAVLDTVLLALFSTPAIYLWVIKPFVDARDEALIKINHLANSDPLTQLANRRLISEHLKKFISSSVRHKDLGAVLLIDLDGFKLVNDNHGHEAGDAVLLATAQRLQTIVRTEDVVGRLGGDEFIVLIHRLGADERIAHDRTLVVANKLINSINKPVDFSGKSIHVGASVGIRLLGFEKLAAETVISEADIAMYRAKNSGKGCAVLFEK
jgi:diguanylate cyclase (GGDEF)-like protein